MMQFKQLAVIAPLLALASASPVAEPSKSTRGAVQDSSLTKPGPEDAGVAARAQLEKDSDDVWLWKKREAAQLEKDSDDVWLWKRADDSDDVWLWKRGQEATIKRAKLAKDSDDVWLWKKREAAKLEKDSDDVWLWKKREASEKSKLVKDADDIWLW